MKHILSVLVENEPGVLSRVAGLFSGRGFNVESLNVAPTLDKGVSHMTITTTGDAAIIEQIIKQLRKLITVIKVVNITPLASVEREMILIKVNADDSKRDELMRLVDVFRCKVIDISTEDVTIEATGTNEKLQAFVAMLTKFGVKDIARTGVVAMRRSMQNNHDIL